MYSNKDLIAEAREFLRSENAQYYDSSLIGALADALEAAARQPSEDDREAAFESGMESIDWDMVRDGVGDPQEAAGVAVRAALGTLAAVPDAASGESERRAWAIAGHLERDREAVKAERDAAVAAIERVRSAVNGPHPANSGLDSFTLAHISAALDGAPEPEALPVEGEKP